MKLITLLTTILLTSLLSFAQIPKEAFDLSRSLNKLRKNNEIDKAVENSLELYRIYPEFLVKNIHSFVAKQIKDDLYEQYSIEYITKLHQRNNEEINYLIEPLRQWSFARETNDSLELKSILSNLNKLLEDSLSFQNKTQRYCLMALSENSVQNNLDKKFREEVLLEVIENLSSYKYLLENVNGKNESETRAWYRYLLAYSYYFLYLNFDDKEEYLSNASMYNPDYQDILVRGAYYDDAELLTGNTQNIGYKTEYLTYLKENGKTNQALEMLTEIAFIQPTDDNIELSKTYYQELFPDSIFKNYWTEYINSKCIEVPDVIIDFPNEQLDLSQKTNKWIFIDVWGTWCRPCVKELPELQTFYIENNQGNNSELEIYTFSYASKELSKFMIDNNYTFPVSEISKDINNSFHIMSYPTKILITPDGKYLKIPFNVDWKMYIKNYIQM